MLNISYPFEKQIVSPSFQLNSLSCSGRRPPGGSMFISTVHATAATRGTCPFPSALSRSTRWANPSTIRPKRDSDSHQPDSLTAPHLRPVAGYGCADVRSVSPMLRQSRANRAGPTCSLSASGTSCPSRSSGDSQLSSGVPMSRKASPRRSSTFRTASPPSRARRRCSGKPPCDCVVRELSR